MPLIADTLMRANELRQMFGLSANATWTHQAANIFISRDAGANIIDEYTGMNGSIAVKQADVVLNTFPLAYMQNYSAQDALDDLDYVCYSRYGMRSTLTLCSTLVNSRSMVQG